jgi:hypothetical protein
MTLDEYIARLKEIREAVSDLRMKIFNGEVEGAPVNLQTYGGDLIQIYTILSEMIGDVGGFAGAEDAPRAGYEDAEEKEDYL